ncbi:hypothetical protein [Mariniblastus fucicola]|uniref:Uncharacterized protein n=1 Tax=Mariniblastus fucicola TaxID=980251 RepID=A0A5B9PBA9_9BACT|nr:hypothetical protein [Mariniblastus fucicola]QEG23628.1 hypothetical protein MFFC18_35290 [Mariniblastus fucicola]
MDVRTLGPGGVAQLEAKGISSMPAMIYYSADGISDPRVYHGWKPKAAMRKMFDHTRDLPE